jgi:hypothetical protein
MRLLRSAAIGAALVALGVSTVACKKPGAGDPCREIGRATCVDAAHALSCRGYSWHLDRCLGAHACSEHDGTTTCDQTIAEENDTCGERGKLTCTADHKAMLRCDGAKFHEASTCRGANGCDAEHGRATCDTRIAREGDSCIVAEDPRQHHACNETESTELACVEGVFVRWNECRGEKKCHATLDGVVICDESLANAGDPCHTWGQTCSADRRFALQCSDMMNGHWTERAGCEGPRGCRPGEQPGYVSCDQSMSHVGAPCNLTGGSRACTRDGKTMLYCGALDESAAVETSSGKRSTHRRDTCAIGPRGMLAERTCPHKCEVTDTYWECT